MSRVTTKDQLSFLYGQLEVVAKFPSGDWLISGKHWKILTNKIKYLIIVWLKIISNLVLLEIALVSKSNDQNKLVLATVLGNTNLKCNNIDEGSNIVKYGLKIDKQYHIPSNMMKSISDKRWSDDYHSFILSWTHENIVVKIDGESNFVDTSNLPLDIIFDAEVKYKIQIMISGYW